MVTLSGSSPALPYREDRYYPKGYQPEMLPFWPSEKPIFLPESMVPEQMKKKAKSVAK